MISSSSAIVTYIGDGSTSTYDFPFKIFDESDLYIIVTDTSGVDVEISEASGDFSVEGVGEDDGGTITLTDGDLTASYTITIKRVRPLTQEYDFRNAGEYYPVAHEDALDNLCMIAQQQQEEIDRTLKLHISEQSFDPTLPAGASLNYGKTIMINSSGDGFDWGPAAADLSAAAGAESAAMGYAVAAESAASLAESYAIAAASSASDAYDSMSSALDTYGKIQYEIKVSLDTGSALTDGGGVVLLDPSGGSFTVTLPTLSANQEVRLIFKNTTSSLEQVTIDGEGSEEIDGETTYIMSEAYQHVGVVGTSGQWVIIQ